MNESKLPIEPLVSVCIPTFNRSDRLFRAVRELLTCSYKNLEIIISDNASSDDTQQVCERFCRESGRVRYFRQTENIGPTRNFEFVRSQAIGKYFIWHGDDDYLASNYIELCVKELEGNSSLVLVSGLAAYHRGDGVLTRYGNVTQPKFSLGFFRVLVYIFEVWDNSIFCGVYVRQRVASCIAPNCLAGDWIWIATVLLEGPVKVLPSIHVYRQQGDSTSSTVDRIVQVLGLPRWQKKCPWIVIPNNLAFHVAFRSSFYKKSNLLKKAFIYCLIFCVSIFRQFLIFLSVQASRFNLKILGLMVRK